MIGWKVGHNDAWRVAGSTVTDGCHAPAQSVSALSTRLVRVRPATSCRTPGWCGRGGIIAMQDRLTGGVEDAQVHTPGVQIDAAIESVRLLIGWLFVEAHHGLLAMGVGA